MNRNAPTTSGTALPGTAPEPHAGTNSEATSKLDGIDANSTGEEARAEAVGYDNCVCAVGEADTPAAATVYDAAAGGAAGAFWVVRVPKFAATAMAARDIVAVTIIPCIDRRGPIKSDSLTRMTPPLLRKPVIADAR